MSTDPRDVRAHAWMEIQNIMANAQGRSLTADEQQRFDKFEAEIRSATSKLTYEELDNEFSSVREQPTSVLAGGHRGGPQPDVHILKPEERMAAVAPPENYSTEGVTVRSLVRAAVSGDWDAIPVEARAMALGTGAGGGFAVPAPLSARILDKARNQARVMQAGALTVPMDSSTLKFARVAGDPSAGWKLENAAAAASDMTLEQIELTAQTLMGYVKSSVELIEDSSPGVDEVIENAIAKVLALELDRAALRGTGTDPEPLGIRNTTGVTLQSLGANGAAPTYAAISTAVETVRANNYEPNAIVYSPRTAGFLDRMTDSTGQPLRRPPSFEGLRKLVTGQVPNNLTHGTATNASEAYVGQFNQLLIGIRQRLTIEMSGQASDATDSAWRQYQIHFRAVLRADVAVAQPAAFVVVTGIIP